MSTKKLAYAAAVAVIYIVVTLAAAPISFGLIQVRVSEALTVLPALSPWTIWGLFIGCLISNIYTGQIVDIVFGSIATLLAVAVGAAVYGMVLLKIRGITAEEIEMMPKGKKLSALLHKCHLI